MTDAWGGRPQNPERDGWHWLRRVGESARDAPWLWQESLWCHGPDAFNPDDMIDMGWHYLGPCLTPAEVAAQVAAAVTAEREVWKNVVDVAAIWLTAALECPSFVWDGDQHDAVTQTRDELNAILARPAPSGADALAAMLAAARREGIEAALAAARKVLCDAEQLDICDAVDAVGDACDAIRALLPGDAALARDFAAWTEGESDG